MPKSIEMSQTVIVRSIFLFLLKQPLRPWRRQATTNQTPNDAAKMPSGTWINDRIDMAPKKCGTMYSLITASTNEGSIIAKIAIKCKATATPMIFPCCLNIKCLLR